MSKETREEEAPDIKALTDLITEMQHMLADIGDAFDFVIHHEKLSEAEIKMMHGALRYVYEKIQSYDE